MSSCARRTVRGRIEAATTPHHQPKSDVFPTSMPAGIFARKGAPKAIIDKLAGAVDQALDDSGVQTRLADLGGSLPSKDERTPAKFSGFVKAEIARWSPILKAANAEGK
jgi:tripartite-type tricarboxylate transporter receptor subunit TctC